MALGTPPVAGLRLFYLGVTRTIQLRSVGEPAGERLPSSNEATDADADAASTAAGHDDDKHRADLELLMAWLGPAQWLYGAYALSRPHNTPAWAAWYAARLAALTTEDGDWTTLACVGAASTENWNAPGFPENAYMPAWMLAAQPEAKRAVVLIRGSNSGQDWAINAAESPDSHGGPLTVGGVPFTAHGGMLRAARAILGASGVRAILDKLRDAQYTLTIIGHSLGGGVGSLLTCVPWPHAMKPPPPKCTFCLELLL